MKYILFVLGVLLMGYGVGVLPNFVRDLIVGFGYMILGAYIIDRSGVANPFDFVLSHLERIRRK